MSWNGAGVYTRGYASWSNDAASNLPISATKFDLEDNDFAGGINNCLTKDGQNSPTAALTWMVANAAPLTLLRQTDGTVLGVGRANGTNNPVLQVQVNDGVGVTLNLSTNQVIDFNIQGTNVLQVSAGLATVTGTGEILAVVGTSTDSRLYLQNTTTGSGLSAGTMVGNIGGTAYLYNYTAGALSFGTAGIDRMDISAAGNVTINQAASGIGLAVTAANGTQGLSVAGFSLNQGVSVSSGFAEFLSGNTTATYMGTSAAASTGTLSICTASVQRIGLTSTGNVTVNAPTSGTSLQVNGQSGGNALYVSGSGVAGNSYGIAIQAGTSTADAAFRVFNSNATSEYFAIDGAGNVLGPTLASGVLGNMYSGIPTNIQSNSYAFTATDANKCVIHNTATTGHTYTMNTGICPIGAAITIINPNGGGAITIAQGSGVTLEWFPVGGTGNRTLAGSGQCTLYQWAANNWSITGVGLS